MMRSCLTWTRTGVLVCLVSYCFNTFLGLFWFDWYQIILKIFWTFLDLNPEPYTLHLHPTTCTPSPKDASISSFVAYHILYSRARARALSLRLNPKP
jgi:hypothetical protein